MALRYILDALRDPGVILLDEAHLRVLADV
jgi:hypothetical protein